MVRVYQLALAASVQRLSDVYGDGAGVVNQANNIPYRQLTISAAGAIGYLGAAATVTTVTGFPIAVNGSLTLGPFDAGPVKLSDLYVIGAGSTLTILGVPF